MAVGAPSGSGLESLAGIVNLLAGEDSVSAAALFLRRDGAWHLVDAFGAEGPELPAPPDDADPVDLLQRSWGDGGTLYMLSLEHLGVGEGCLCLLLTQERPDLIEGEAGRLLRDIEGRFLAENRHHLELGEQADAVRERLRAVFDGSPCPSVIARNSGLIENANPAFEALAAMPLKELVGRSLFHLGIFPDAAAARRAIHTSISRKGPAFVRLTHDYTPHEAAIGAARVDRDTLYLAFRHFGDHASIRKRLLEAQKRSTIRSLIGRIVHSINNPLTTIMGFAQLLSRDAGIPIEQHKQIEQIASEARRCRRHIGELVALSRPTEREISRINVNRLVVSCIEMHQLDAHSQGISIRRDLADRVPGIDGDHFALVCAIDEGIVNALETFREAAREGLITIRTRVEGGGVLALETEDDAGGAPEPGRVFEAFYTTRKEAGHLGLGLAMVRAMAEEGHGAAAFTNTDRGALLRLELRIPGA